MTKVCHITSAHNRYDGRIFQRECVSLSENGYNVTLLVNDMKKAEVKDGVSICTINKEYHNRFGRINAVKCILKKALKIDADIYHLHDPELLLIANMYFRYESRIFRRIDGVVSAGSMMINGKRFDPFGDRCKNVVDLGNYPREINRNLPINKSTEFKVCYVGGLTHERGITTLINACYRAGCKLILAGEFSSEAYHKELKENLSYSCVDYRGVCDRQEIYNIYEETSVGAATLLNTGQYYKMNGFATKVIEYFQMKLPVIISNYPYAVDMNEEYLPNVQARAQDKFESLTVEDTKVEGNITVDQDKMLFFSIPYTEGWSATVNGETVEVEKANVGFMAIPITEGENHVVLKYRTPWLLPGILISGVIFVTYITVVIVLRVKRKHKLK